VNDAATATKARRVAEQLARVLRPGYSVGEVFPSGNVDGGWIFEATKRGDDGFFVNVEVVGGPWEDDGSYEERT
jgi:hypothetical protein